MRRETRDETKNLKFPVTSMMVPDPEKGAVLQEVVKHPEWLSYAAQICSALKDVATPPTTWADVESVFNCLYVNACDPCQND